MTTKFFDNFNFEPVSTTRETTTYNLPAGTYARIIPQLRSVPLIANGITLENAQYEDRFLETFSLSFTTVYTIPQGSSSTGYIGVARGGATANAATYSIKNSMGVSIYTGATSSTAYVTQAVTLHSGDYIELKTGGVGSDARLLLQTDPLNQYPSHYWVSGGAAGIIITGDEFIVELYNSQGN
jgi:hypothetical protein